MRRPAPQCLLLPAWLLGLSVMLTSVGDTLQAGSPTQLEKNPPVTFAPEVYPWSFSVGATVRSIDADFHLSAPPALNFRGLVRQQRGLGDVGLFSGGSVARYDNGSVGPDLSSITPAPVPPGTSTGVALAQGGNIRNEGRFGLIGVPLGSFEYYSHSYSYSSSLQSTSVDVGSSDVGVGPYLEFSRRVADGSPLIVDAFVGWSYVETSHSSGHRPVARQSIIERDVRHTYSYEGIPLIEGLGTPPGFPNASGIVIYDLRQYESLFPLPIPLGIRDARQTDRVTNRIIASFYAVTGGDLDVRLNEIPVGVKVGRRFGSLTVLAELGVLLAVIDYDLDAESRWYRSSGAFVTRQTWHDSDASVRMGAFGGVSLQYDLSKDGRWFAEAHGTYRWVDSADASAGPVRVKIDVSSWEGGIGLGYRL